MMPIGLLLLLAEMSLLKKLMIAPAEHALATTRAFVGDGSNGASSASQETACPLVKAAGQPGTQ